ncbi:MAG: amino acid adenylation domain-containing protein [Chloroflexia bacterium]
MGRSSIGTGDGFFNLGGHSLQVAQIVSRIGERFGVTLAPQVVVIYEQPTITLARSVETRRWAVPRARPSRHWSALALPLSSAQQRLWFFDRLVQEARSTISRSSSRSAGNLDADELGAPSARSCDDTDAYERLCRSRPRSSSCRRGPFSSMERADLRTLAADAREAEARRLLDEHACQPFDLSQGPLLRALLLRTGEREHRLLLTVHHIAFDGWSAELFLRELAALYQADGAILPEPAIGYADFATWQRDWLQGDTLERLQTYWRSQFPAAPPLLALPTDRPRPLTQSYRGAKLVRSCPPELLDALERLGRREGASLFMTLIAAFQTLLHRYSGQEDVVVAVPVANRTRREIEGLVGFFTNTLPLRTDLSGDPSFRDLLARVRAVALGAHAHEDLPFDLIVQAVGAERDPGSNPLAQVMFGLQNVPLRTVELPDLRIAFAAELATGTAKYDLSLFVDYLADGPVFAAEYSTDLFDAATIERLIGHFASLLNAIVAAPDGRIADFPLLSAAEEAQLQQLAAGPVMRYPADLSLHQLVEAQVARTPDAVAVLFDDEQLTYAELDQRANRLARHLRDLGVGRDTPVALCIDRSPDLIVSVLAVLKAGGAYLPLDPAYPRDRLAIMLEDAQTPVLLAQRRLLELLPQHNARTLCLEEIWPMLGTLPEAPLSAVNHPDDLAYVLYTSGSTGRPKGVAMRHGALTNLLSWQLATTTLDHPARTLQFAALSFDVASQEIFFSLISGGTLVLIGEDERRDFNRLITILERDRVERLFLPFVALQHLAQAAAEPGTTPPSRLREVITAGEQLQVTPAVADFFARLPGSTLHNQYGPTETHVATAFTLDGSPDGWMALPPIGRPIANTAARILDRRMRPVPLGVPGELYLGGAALARGYLHRPDLTAERFLADPFSQEPGARMYKTGDLARFLPDGNIEFLGRIDQQVKIRGYRVELGEIEARLAQHTMVRDSAVVAHAIGSVGGKRLVAYATVREGDAPSVADLRAWVAAQLPEYMVPAAVVILAAFPLTPSGKVDRRALPEPGEAAFAQRESVAPRTPLETVIAGVWADVLGLEQIGVHDNFFELGGHSLLATQVVSHLRALFEIELPLRDIFRAPTVAELAGVLMADPATGQQIEQTAELLLQMSEMDEAEVEELLAGQSAD